MARVRCGVVLLVALVVCGSAQARVSAAPKGLHGFILRADEPVVHTFARTPSFAWRPVRGARSYQFELATSRSFNDNAIVWAAKGLKIPAVSVPVSLPWMTGQPYSLYAHVRAVTSRGTGKWGTAFGFNMRWTTVPAPLTPSYPGLLRWSAVPGASGYTVWLVDADKRFTTRTNMADEREYYTFHQDPSWTGTVSWRVRAMRQLNGTPENGIPTVSYGPWSPVYSSTNPPFSTGPLTLQQTVSKVVSDATRARAHEVMPAFLYRGDTSIWGNQYDLYRVEVFTDEDCLNPVFRGAIVGSPAYVPRESGPLAMPSDVNGISAASTSFLPAGVEPDSKTADDITVKTNEMDISSDSQSAKVDLWDSDWPSGRYYWTVMPVDIVPDQVLSTVLALPVLAGATTVTVANATGILAGDALQIGSPFSEHAIVQGVNGNDITLTAPVANFHSAGETVIRPSGGVKYRDAELTQDSCAAGRKMTFGKSSEPAVTGQSAPFASGLSPTGKLVSAPKRNPRFYGQTLVAWEPTLATDKYEVQWSHKAYPWRTAGSQTTFSTAMTLPLSPGTWFYRVRGIDDLMIGPKPQLSWSNPVRLVVTKPRFRIVH